MRRVMTSRRGTPLRAIDARRCRGRTSRRFQFSDGSWVHVHGEPGDWLAMGVAGTNGRAEYWFLPDAELRKTRWICWDLDPLGDRDGYEDDAPVYPYPNRGEPFKVYRVDLQVSPAGKRYVAVITRGWFEVARHAHACPRTAVRRARYEAMERVRFGATG